MICFLFNSPLVQKGQDEKLIAESLIQISNWSVGGSRMVPSQLDFSPKVCACVWHRGQK